MLGLVATISAWIGCASVSVRSTRGRENEPVGKVIWQKSSGLDGAASHAREIGNTAYPRVLSLLLEDPATAPAQFDIIFTHLKSRDTALTHLQRTNSKRARIFINSDYFMPGREHWDGTNYARLEMVLIHEMAHVAQQIPTNMPSYWTEGVADYVRYKLGYSNNWYGAECSAEYPNYRSGYCCTAAFLLFFEANEGPEVVRRLNGTLRNGSYSDDFFEEATGRTLAEWWAEFERTGAYTASAAKMTRLENALGYVNGKPPPDIEARFDAWVRRLPGGHDTADALRYVKTLAQKGSLPGFSKRIRPVFLNGERLGGSFYQPDKAHVHDLPVSRTLYCYDQSGDFTYYYVVTRTAAPAGWKITKAWRTGRSGENPEPLSQK
jgi:hypothetical protein